MKPLNLNTYVLLDCYLQYLSAMDWHPVKVPRDRQEQQVRQDPKGLPV